MREKEGGNASCPNASESALEGLTIYIKLSCHQVSAGRSVPFENVPSYSAFKWQEKPCHHVSLQVHSFSEAFPEVRYRALGKTNLDWIVLIAFKLESCCCLSRRGNRLLRQRWGVTRNPALRAMEESICFNMVYSSRHIGYSLIGLLSSPISSPPPDCK